MDAIGSLVHRDVLDHTLVAGCQHSMDCCCHTAVCRSWLVWCGQALVAS
jgi:hypothetical protein